MTSFVLPQSFSSVILEVRCAALGAPGSGKVHPRTWKQASRMGEVHGVFELEGPLEMAQLVGGYCPPRSICCIHEQAFALFALISIRWDLKVSPRAVRAQADL